MSGIVLPPAPFELSDAIIRIIGPFWWQSREGTCVDPFSVTVFVNELCGLFSYEKLVEAREKNSVNFDLAIFRSSWVVFLALHLGYCDLEYINELRTRIFDENISGEFTSSSGHELDELIAIAYASLRNYRVKLIKADSIGKGQDKASLKLIARLDRVIRELVNKNGQPPSIYGKGGFIDV
jgi:hypothetical protein